jgi:hypothetical protein
MPLTNICAHQPKKPAFLKVQAVDPAVEAEAEAAAENFKIMLNKTSLSFEKGFGFVCLLIFQSG